MKLFYFTLFMFKRYLKSPAFAAILVLVPLCCAGLGLLGFGDDIRICAGLYNESKTDISFLADYEGAVRFKIYNSPEEMQNEVASKKIECGYYLTEGMPAVYDREGLTGSVICYKSPSTVFDKVVNEILFSELFKGYAYDIAAELAEEGGYNNKEELKTAYEHFLNEDAVISLSYEYIEDTADNSENVNMFSFLKGILGIFIMTGALLGAFRAARDEKTGIFKALPPGRKALLSYAYFIVPSLLCAASALLGLYISRAYSLKGELFETVVFAFAAGFFAAFIYALFFDDKIIGVILSLLLLASLIFCPVFVDIGSISKSAKILQGLLLPTYYIKGDLVYSLIICLLLSYLALFVRFCIRKE